MEHIDERVKRYHKVHVEDAFYHSKQWVAVRNRIRSYYMGCDVLKWYRTKIVSPVTHGIVHHIIPREENPDLWYEASNLVLLSKTTHDQVHAEYNRSDYARAKMQKELHDAQEAWHKFLIDLGVIDSGNEGDAL